MLQNKEHYHVILNSKKIRIPEIIVKTRREAEDRYEYLMMSVKETTKSRIKFAGSGCILFESGDSITKHICIHDCLDYIVDGN